MEQQPENGSPSSPPGVNVALLKNILGTLMFLGVVAMLAFSQFRRPASTDLWQSAYKALLDGRWAAAVVPVQTTVQDPEPLAISAIANEMQSIALENTDSRQADLHHAALRDLAGAERLLAGSRQGTAAALVSTAEGLIGDYTKRLDLYEIALGQDPKLALPYLLKLRELILSSTDAGEGSHKLEELQTIRLARRNKVERFGAIAKTTPFLTLLAQDKEFGKMRTDWDTVQQALSAP